ncbi:MAG TPA: PQQ-binding-like beta-propeller repeat protein [Methanomassiliicoccales archaeon]|nr:PQQ-binding-like beta-propeller repeat protein [Methanomassiliicoccales archaeon]
MTGATGINAASVEAIAWSYAAYIDPNMFIGPHAPIATPDNRYPWQSYRHDSFNTGLQPSFATNNMTAKWSANLSNGAIDTQIVVGGGREYVVTGGIMDFANPSLDTNASLICLNASGDIQWTSEMGRGYQVASPLLYAGMLIAPCGNGVVYAFDAETGARVWTFDTGSRGFPGISSSPIAYRNHIVLAANNGKLYSLFENGTQDWNVSLGSGIYSSSPAAKNGTFYIGNEDGQLKAIFTNGTIAWSASLGSKVRGSPTLVTDGIVVSYLNYTGTSPTNGGVAKVAYNGTLMWRTVTGQTPGSATLTANGFVSVNYTAATMIGLGGGVAWTTAIGGDFSNGPPTAISGSIFILRNDGSGHLIALGAKTGAIYTQKVLAPVNYALGSPTISDGVLYATSDNGWVYAFNLNDVAPSPSTGFTISMHNLMASFETPVSTGNLFQYSWDFGDSASASGRTASHTYSAPGTYAVNLTISNPAGQTLRLAQSVTVHDFTAPRGLVALAGQGEVTLNWTAPSDNGGVSIVSYKIYRAVQGGEASLLATVLASNLTYVDTTGVAGTTYSYYVVAVNGQGAGPASAAQTATPQAAPVDNTVLYVGIVIVVLAILGAAAIFVMRGRKK